MQKIIFDCERMKRPFTGLYTYCYHLGVALEKQVDPAREHLRYYLPENRKGVFGDKADYFIQRSWHKFLPVTAGGDLWHSTYQTTNYFPASRKIKKILTVHDLNFMHEPAKSEAKRKMYLAGLQKKVEVADAVTAISEFALDEMKRFLKIDERKFSVIYNGCNINSEVIPEAPETVPAAPFLFTIGTIVDKKNFHVLPPLLKGNNYLLLIAGVTESDQYRQKILEEARRWKVEERLHFIGAIPEAEKYWYLQHCLAFLFPSLLEGFGLPVIEAMYFGKPVLLANSTSLPEIGGQAAYYFKNFDPEVMQSTLQQALEHYNSQHPEEQIRKQAAKFSWDEAASAYLALYRKVLS